MGTISNKQWAKLHDAINEFGDASVAFSWLGSRPKSEHEAITKRLHDARRQLDGLIADMVDAAWHDGACEDL